MNLQVHLLIYVAPVCIKFQYVHYPLLGMMYPHNFSGMTSSTPPSFSLAFWRSSNHILHSPTQGCSFLCSPSSQKCPPVRNSPIYFVHPSTENTCYIISRPSSSDRDGADTLARVAPIAFVQQPLVAARNRECKLLLCLDACVRDGQWRSFAGRGMGGAPNSRGEAGGWLRGNTGMIAVCLQMRTSGGDYINIKKEALPITKMNHYSAVGPHHLQWRTSSFAPMMALFKLVLIPIKYHTYWYDPGISHSDM